MNRVKKRSHMSTFKDINVVPLIDITMFLLIVFMITVPLLEYSVNVSPPELNAAALSENNDLFVDLTKEYKIMFKKNEVTPEQLTVELKEVIASSDNTFILLRADGLCVYQRVMDVIKAIKAAGVKNISLVTQAEKG